MKLTISILWIFCLHNSLHSQTDTSSVDSESSESILSRSINIDESVYKITNEEFDCLKKAIQKDHINWPNNANDTIGNMWYKMAAQDTSVYVMIDLGSTHYRLDVLKEYKRRVTGGFAGSFPFAKTWSFDIPEQTLIDAIIQLGENTPNLTISHESDEFEGRHSHWYFIRVFDQTTNEIIQIWTRDNKTEPPSASLALIGYSEQGELDSEQRLINRDFWEKENNERIDNFEKVVVDQLKQIVEKGGF